MTKTYDITIIGAGPAGATLARLLSPKYKILLVDKRTLTEFENVYNYEKCCGGLLAPDAQKVLAKLGLGVPKSVLTGPQPFTVKTIDFDNNLERFYQRHYINVDREKFDSWLVSLIPDNVDREFSCSYRNFKEESGHITVNLRKNGQELSISTKILIGADGAISRVRNQAFGNYPFPKKYASIQEWYHTDEQVPYFMSIFDKSVTDFYSWTIQKENLMILGTAVPAGPDANNKFELLKSNLIEHGYHFGNRFKRRGTVIFRPNRRNQIQLGNDKIALIGEAAGFISPSSAEGISYALKSGIALAKSINEDCDAFSKRYQRKSKSLKRNIFLKTLKSRVMYSPFLRKLVMKSKFLSMDVES